MQTANLSSDEADVVVAVMYHWFSPAEIVCWFVLYGVIAFLAVSGNMLVVFVVLTRKKLQNVPNYFIVNLAVSCAFLFFA